MNWLDNAIGFISPERGFKRARARAALEIARGYEGAKQGRRTGNWVTGGTSANAEIQPALVWLRNRSRDLIRNNPYARKAINTLVSRSIGTGILAKSDLGDVWAQWCDECDADEQLDFNGLMAQACRTVFESGEALIRFRNRRADEGFTVPLQIQVLEPDFIDSSKNGPMDNGNMAISGIEFNSFGKRVAYWLFDSHPGDTILTHATWKSKRISASEILHIYEKERPGQVRGVPRLAVALIKLKDFDDYEEAELVRKKIEACFSAFVTTSTDNGALGQLSNDVATPAKRIETLEPGMITYLNADEAVAFGSPNASAGYKEYGSTQLHAIAAGVGVTYEQLTGDLSGVNYSSMRGGIVEFRILVEMYQWLTFIPMACKPIHRRVAEIAYIAGSTRKKKSQAFWTTPKWPWVDPLKDIQAEVLAIDSNLKSTSESIRESGYDPDAVFKEKAKDKQKLESLGLNATPKKIVAPTNNPEEETAGTENNDETKNSDKAKE